MATMERRICQVHRKYNANRVGIKPNLSKLQPQFSRVSFYDMGSRYIDLLIKDKPALKTDIKGYIIKCSILKV